MNLRRALSVLLTLILVGCAESGEDASSTTSTGKEPTTTMTVTTTEVTTQVTTEVTISDLTGRWENQALVLEVTSGGEYVLGGPGDDSESLMWGFVARQEDQFIFVTSTTAQCPGQTGVYTATVDVVNLTLTLVEDPCAVRSAGFATPLTRSE